MIATLPIAREQLTKGKDFPLVSCSMVHRVMDREL